MLRFLQFLHQKRRKAFRRYPFHVHIAALFTLLTVALCLALILFQSRQMSRMALAAARTQFSQINDRVDAELTRSFMPIQAAIDLLVYKQSLHSADLLARKVGNLANLRDALEQSQSVSALFVAYHNGDFFQIRLVGADEKSRYRAQAALLVSSLERHADGRVDKRIYLYSRDLELLEERKNADLPALDVRERDWFRQIRDAGRAQVVTPMYVFENGEIGATFARRAESGEAVVGADITVEEVSGFLASAGLTPSSHLYLLDPDGRILLDRYPQSHAGKGLVKLADMGSPMLAEVAGRVGQPPSGPAMLEHGGRKWLMQLTKVPGPGNSQLHLVLLAPEDELLADVGSNRQHALLITLLTVLVSVALVWRVARRAAQPLNALTREADEIRTFRFAESERLRSHVAEIDDLADSMHLLKSSLRRFLEIGSALGGERQFDRLLARILKETAGVAQAEGGIIYLANGSCALRPVAALGKQHDALDVTQLPAVSGEPAHPVEQAFAGSTVTVCLDQAALQHWLPMFASRALTACAIPLANRDKTVIGVLLLLIDEDHYPQGALPELLALVEALSGTVTAAIETQRLLDEQQKLLESFIRLMAGAIDAKSAYTGGHCQRVPVIARLLAEAACAEKEGVFAGFNLSEDDWETLHIASWLHDCGKVTTPDYVVDKATRLETITDRIHEIRTRFEVIKRDAEIRCLNAMLAGGDEVRLRADLAAELAELDADFAFVAACNSGEEVMTAQKIERIGQIAERRWQRTLDDRLGVSPAELARKAQMPAASLPVTETLLADRPDQRIARGPHDYPQEGLGLRLEVPQWLYDRGEIHNLTIERGTLTQEERYKINDHINQTIAMLAKLPLPHRLAQVPEIAAGHHERVDGRGYPRQLRGEEMSLLARMMAVADVFEALTAADRPYKPAKKLSEALAIMQTMANSGHLDPEVFALFRRAAVWRPYALDYMPPAQVDLD